MAVYKKSKRKKIIPETYLFFSLCGQDIPKVEKILDIHKYISRNKNLRILIKEKLEEIPVQIKEIIEWQYGFLDGTYHSLKETSEHFNIEQNTIKELVKEGLEEIKVGFEKISYQPEYLPEERLLRALSVEIKPHENIYPYPKEFFEKGLIPVFDLTEYNQLRNHLELAMDSLPPREVRILQLRYGLLDGESYTQEEAGKKMGVTGERVRQIEEQALKRMRKHPTILEILRNKSDELTTKK